MIHTDAQRRAMFAKGFPKKPVMQGFHAREHDIIGPFGDIDKMKHILTYMEEHDPDFEKLMDPVNRILIIDYKKPFRAEAITSEEIAISQSVLRNEPKQVPGFLYHELYHIYHDRLREDGSVSHSDEPGEKRAHKWAEMKVDELNKGDIK